MATSTTRTTHPAWCARKDDSCAGYHEGTRHRVDLGDGSALEFMRARSDNGPATRIYVEHGGHDALILSEAEAAEFGAALIRVVMATHP